MQPFWHFWCLIDRPFQQCYSFSPYQLLQSLVFILAIKVLATNEKYETGFKYPNFQFAIFAVMFTEILNRSATFHFTIIDKYTAGIQLLGSEVKSIRQGKASLGDAFCFFLKEELFIKNLHISEYKLANQFNHDPMRVRKLLLNAQELKKLHGKVKERGYTIIPLRIFLSETRYMKVEIGLAKGKNVANKKTSIKEKDAKREMDRELNRK